MTYLNNDTLSKKLKFTFDPQVTMGDWVRNETAKVNILSVLTEVQPEMELFLE